MVPAGEMSPVHATIIVPAKDDTMKSMPAFQVDHPAMPARRI
jgi:hypothetical protein